MIDNLIRQLRIDLKQPVENGASKNVPRLLHSLLHKEIWHEDDIKLLNEISKRIDITGNLFNEYDIAWRKISKDPLAQVWQNVMTLLIWKFFELEKARHVSDPRLYKQLNTLLKCLKISDANWVPQLAQSTMKELNILDNKYVEENDIKFPILPFHTLRYSQLTTLPITILFYEGPIARAYLETLYAMNIKPEKIIQLISSVDVVSKKKAGRLLPTSLRKTYADYLQKTKIHHWSNYIRKVYPELHQTIQTEITHKFNFSLDTLDRAIALKPLTVYSDQINTLLIENLNDPKLHAYLFSHSDTTLLFTGGGIVPAVLLKIPQLRFIHIHPGYLPAIKGADGVLWSLLLTGYCSATSFYMSPGIDAGDIIKACWLPKVEFKIDMNEYLLKTLYRAIYGFFDPWVRAYVLRETLSSYQELDQIIGLAQNPSQGLTFHFMHEILQNKALNRLFNKNIFEFSNSF